jgi:hypothetical protein
MARPRFAHEKALYRQARAQRRFHQTNSFNAHNSVVAAFARERGAESLEPTVLTARNQDGVSCGALSRGSTGRMSHAHQPSKPPPNGKATVSGDFLNDI